MRSSTWQSRTPRKTALLGHGLRQPLVLAACLTCSILANSGKAAEGDVYVSYDPNGTPRYANYPLDASYELLIAGTSPAASSLPPPLAPALLQRKSRLAPLIDRYAKQYQLSPALVSAVIAVESRYNPAAISPTGARGAMQLMPATASRFGVRNPHDPAQNIEAGVRYLKLLLDRYNGSIPLALAAYNAGEGTVSRHGARIPPYRETMLYVPAVMAQLPNNTKE